MKVTVVLCVLSLLIGGVALTPATLHAAGWISGADSYAAPWVREAIGVFEEGVRRHYYSQSDIEPIMSFMRQHMPITTT